MFFIRFQARAANKRIATADFPPPEIAPATMSAPCKELWIQEPQASKGRAIIRELNSNDQAPLYELRYIKKDTFSKKYHFMETGGGVCHGVAIPGAKTHLGDRARQNESLKPESCRRAERYISFWVKII